ncbi:hypothetical protein [Halomarina ordinaria]|uniref:DUF2795 domain-containing protein n=1 Tax=Halomarina ordinaria TaxID=3033939 RepID=A0ABD5UC47_9EURY|nr:hypothetical protein [Halomarina sp. PSRA2]
MLAAVPIGFKRTPDALHDLENLFYDNVSLTDLREALVLAGLGHLDEVEAQLRTWGMG